MTSSALTFGKTFPAVLAIAGCIAGAAPAGAEPKCLPVTAASLEIGISDCSQVWPELKASRQFPDVFAGTGKMTNICYQATGPAPAFIGDRPVTIMASYSGWTTDFTPGLFGGNDNIGTVVTELVIDGFRGNSTAKLFTRDTIDLSQIMAGKAPEQDVIVGGTGPLQNAAGTYRIASTPEDMQASKVLLSNLSGLVCVDGQ